MCLHHSTHHCGRGRYRRSRRLVRPGGHTDWTHLTSWFSPQLVGPGQCWWTPTTPTSTRGSRFWGTFREFFRLNWNKLEWELENLPDWGITLLEVWKMLMFSENWLTDWRTSVSTLPSILFLSSYNWFNRRWPDLTSSYNWFHQLDLTSPQHQLYHDTYISLWSRV